MANAINVPKSHLIMGLSLPLAVLLGYFLAEPMELGSMAVVVFVLVVLAIPLMMKWYYPLLVLSWNAAICPAFFPGRPTLWAMMAFIGLLFAIVSRAVSANARFVMEPSIVKPLLVLAAVVVVTGMLTGGFGVHMLGGSQYGGKRYFYFLAAVAGYFVFTSKQIPPQRAGFYVAMFFLSAITFGLGDCTILLGAKLDFVWLFLAPDTALHEAVLDAPGVMSGRAMRLSDFSLVGTAVYGYLLARYGIRGLLDLSRPWRLLPLLLAIAAGLASGFRSFVVLGVLTFAILFYMEGLHRTRYLAILAGVALLGGAIVLPQAEKLPLMAQRALSFLPGKFDYIAKESAVTTIDWRVGMWKEVLPEVPQRLLRGKGWGLDARDYADTVTIGDNLNPLAGTIMAGDYHNGPLSVVMPFGLYGAIAFLWFLIAGWRVLYRNWKYGSIALRTVNGLLLAAFTARSIFFMLFFGSLHSDMAIFTGLLGIGVALNGVRESVSPAVQPATGVEFGTEYIKA